METPNRNPGARWRGSSSTRAGPSGAMPRSATSSGAKRGTCRRAPGRLAEGFRLIFLRLEGSGLEPRDSYEGAWVGAKSNRPEIRVGGIGQPVTGITGNCGNAVDRLGLILGL